MITLRPFQSQLKAEVYAAWMSGARNVLAVAPTGAGKTVIFSDILREFNAASVVIAHRHELVSQISMALARNGVRHRIIGAASLIRHCVNLHMNELGRSYYNPSAPCAAAGVDTLIRMDKSDPWFAQVGLWVQDECFTAGTLIDGRPIETVAVGDMVTAFDHSTGEFSKRKVVRTFKNKQPKHMMRIETSAHHVLNCTNGHPFWTRRGWVTAANLQISDEVLNYEVHDVRCGNNASERNATLSIQESGSNVLHEVVRYATSGIATDSGMEQKGRAVTGVPVPDMRQTCGPDGPSKFAIQTHRSRVLQPHVFGRLPLAQVVRNHGENEPNVRIEADDCEQPHATGGDTGESLGNLETDQTLADPTGRERQTCDRCGDDAACDIFRTGVCDATGDTDPLPQKQPRENSCMLQAGPWEFFDQTRDRGGRDKPLRAQAFGCEEGRNASWVGLDSIAVYESSDISGNVGDDGDGYVYNFEVEDLHTYVANGIVVHNCHHLLRDNKWGKASAMFPNARGLGVTATPMRADGRGLGLHSDGLMEVMVQAPGMRELIDMGFLTDYRIFAPPSDLDLSGVGLSAGGDFSPDPLRKAVHKSHIVGDVVAHYLRIAAGKLGVTFAVDVASAGEIAAEYRAAGVPAEVVSAGTQDIVRAQILRRFAAGEVKQLVNVDLFGEGFDLPAIEVVSMARPTQSFGLYAQQFGRALRLLNGKQWGIIIDHVGNVHRHGLPDAPREWSLDRREKRSRSTVTDVMPVRTCPKCTGVYEADLGLVCPYCAHATEPAGRSLPEHVDGDLCELTPEALARLRGEIDATPSQHPDRMIQMSINARHREKLDAQTELRAAMSEWAAGMDDLPRAWRRFYLTFGHDVLSAQALGRADALALEARIRGSM